jgi:hypothetical protein
MSPLRVKILCVVAVMTTLVMHSSIVYAIGHEPPIFGGLAYLVLLVGWVICGIVWRNVERDYRHELHERTEDFRMSLQLIEWGLRRHDDSGSWRRPN